MMVTKHGNPLYFAASPRDFLVDDRALFNMSVDHTYKLWAFRTSHDRDMFLLRGPHHYPVEVDAIF